MMMFNYKLLWLVAIILFSFNTYATPPIIPIMPFVPASKAKANLVPLKQIKQTNKTNVAKFNKSRSRQVDIKRSNIVMTPGVNEIVQIAQNHLNRIVTPFDSPKVTSSSSATTKTRDNVIYIGSSESTPITLFITEKGSEDLALSLTLIPKKIPPREIFLNLNNQHNQTKISKNAKRWEESQPYISSLESILKSLALNQLPKGYTLTNKDTKLLPVCRQTGLKFNFKNGQTILGHHFIIHIGVTENVSPIAIEFIESTCGDWDIAAVAAFPRVALNPGEQTEVYVIQKRNYQREIKVTRPSLLMAGE